MPPKKSNCEFDEKFIQECEKILRDAGTKITKPRLAVMQFLATSSESLSPRQILEGINKEQEKNSLPPVDQVSVYRILETFSKFGLVHQVFPSGGYIVCTHVNCQAALHILIHCTACEKTEEVDIPTEIFSPMKWYIQKQNGFTPKNHLFQIDGRCASCS